MEILLALAVVLAAFALARWQRRGPVLQYLFFCRYPIWIAIALLGLPFLAVRAAPSLLANLFALEDGHILLVTWLATLVAWAVMITLHMAFCYAPSRFRVPPVALPRWLQRYRVPLFALLALPLAGTAVALSEGSLATRLGWAAAGFAVAFASLVASTAVQVMLGDPAAPDDDYLLPREWPLFARLPRLRLGPLGRTLDRWGHGLLRGPEARGARGYVDPERGAIRGGHVLALSFFLLILGVYALGFAVLHPGRLDLPSLGYLLLVLLLVGWSLPGIAFWLDRYRVPTLLLLAALSFLSGWVFNTDHYFAIEVASPAAAGARSEPAEAMERADRLTGATGPVVVVAASGGGITAALWTARVLTAFQEEAGVEVTRSIRLVSAVSGGSVGTMFFLDRFDESGAPPAAALDEIVRAAGASSLDAGAWGVAYPDLWRAFFGFLVRRRTLDRGWAMEQAWKNRLARPEARLSSWSRATSEGWLPAAVLNATIAETGEQLLFSTVAPSGGWHTRDFYATYRGHDLPVSTAARLSATFPWVSPLARPALDGRTPVMPGFHLGDGGYFDNFGVVSVVHWLQALAGPDLEEVERRGLLLVLIRASPAPGQGAADRPLPPGEHRGWQWAVAGPVITLMNVRGSSQSFRGALELELLEAVWQERRRRLAVVPFVLDAEAPLSWKLTDAQRRRIRAGLGSAGNRRALACVRGLFNASPAGLLGPPGPSPDPCAEFRAPMP